MLLAYVWKHKSREREFVSQLAPWFEREFDFSFPASLYPNLCARLRGTPARLEEVLTGHPRARLTTKPLEKWSAQEHAGHLLDLESLWLTRVEDYVRGSMQLTPTDLSNRRTSEANHNASPLGRILSSFRAGRQKLLERVSELDSSFRTRSIPPPRLKTPMRLIDHLFFVAEHDDHHLAQIWELIHSSNLSA